MQYSSTYIMDVIHLPTVPGALPAPRIPLPIHRGIAQPIPTDIPLPIPLRKPPGFPPKKPLEDAPPD
jgi:hypothetical protein